MEEQAVETFAMRLANRAYLYRILHIAFGAEPSEEELEVLGSGQTGEALRFLAQTDEAARVRIAFDTSEGTREEPAAEALERAAGLAADLGAKAHDAEAVSALKDCYTRLLVVPGPGFVYPWESPYIGQETMIFQESTLDVRARFKAQGYQAVLHHHFPEDHISMMLDFLAHLSTRAFEAYGDGDDARARKTLKAQVEFIEAHLGEWVSEFAREVRKKDVLGAYATLADALSVFLEIDRLFVRGALAEGGALAE